MIKITKGGIYMSSISKLSRGFICILIIFLFIVVGLVSSFISAVIECTVFVEIFDTNMIDYKITLIFSIGIAICFEIVKNFSNFILPVISLINPPNHSLVLFGKKAKKCRFILVVISLLCTLIFTGNTLTKNIISNEEHNKAVEQITKEYKTETNEIESNIKENYTSELKRLLSEMQNAQEEKDKAAIAHGKKSDIYLYFEEVYNEKKQNYEYFQSNGLEIIKKNNGYNSKLDILKKDYDDKVKNASSTSDSIQQSTYLRNFINMLGLESSDTSIYIVSVFIISCLISIILEMIISLASSFLGANSNMILNELDRQIKLTDTEIEKIKYLFKTICNAAICLGVYLIIMLFNNEIIIMNSVLIVFVSYLVSNFNLKLNLNEEAESLLSKTKEIFLSGIIAFVAYFIFGLLFGNKYTDISTVAVTFGAIIGQYLNLEVPFNFFKKNQ